MAVAFIDIPPAPDIHFAAEAYWGFRFRPFQGSNWNNNYCCLSVLYQNIGVPPNARNSLDRRRPNGGSESHRCFNTNSGGHRYPFLKFPPYIRTSFFSKIGTFPHEHLNLSRCPPEHLASPTCLLRHLKSRSGPIIHRWFLGKSPHGDQKHGSFFNIIRKASRRTY